MHHFAFFVSATQSVVVSTKKNQYSEANQKTGFCILFSCFLIYPLRISRFSVCSLFLMKAKKTLLPRYG